MKLADILRSVGGGIIREAVPGGAAIIDAVNSFLPENKKLGGNASGFDIENAISTLPPEQAASIYSRSFDVQETQIKEEHASIRAMLEAESHSKHTTRPLIARGAFYVYSVCTCAIVLMLGYAVIKSENPLDALNNSSMFLLSLVGPYPALLYAYFGILKKEHENRLNAANGKQAGVSSLLNLFKR